MELEFSYGRKSDITTTLCSPTGELLYVEANPVRRFGIRLKMPCGDDGIKPAESEWPLLKRHTTHNVTISYGPGKQKIGLIATTRAEYEEMGDGKLGLKSHVSCNWAADFLTMDALEEGLRDWKCDNDRVSDQESESGMEKVDRSKTYQRKLARNLYLETFEYSGGYTATRRCNLAQKTVLKTAVLTTGLKVM